MESNDIGVVPFDKIVRVYIRLRDKREELTSTYNKEYKALSDKMAVVKGAVLAQMREANVESMSTAEGVVYRTVDRKYWTSDWETMHRFIVENNAPQLLERRIHQSNAKEFFESNPNLVPPGLKVDSEYSVTIRRK